MLLSTLATVHKVPLSTIDAIFRSFPSACWHCARAWAVRFLNSCQGFSWYMTCTFSGDVATGRVWSPPAVTEVLHSSISKSLNIWRAAAIHERREMPSLAEILTLATPNFFLRSTVVSSSRLQLLSSKSNSGFETQGNWIWKIWHSTAHNLGIWLVNTLSSDCFQSPEQSAYQAWRLVLLLITYAMECFDKKRNHCLSSTLKRVGEMSAKRLMIPLFSKCILHTFLIWCIHSFFGYQLYTIVLLSESFSDT